MKAGSGGDAGTTKQTIALSPCVAAFEARRRLKNSRKKDGRHNECGGRFRESWTMKNKVCPMCGSYAHRVIYLGLPMWICDDDECSTLWGFFSIVAVWFPIANPYGYFAFLSYKCSYPRALWHWLFQPGEDQ